VDAAPEAGVASATSVMTPHRLHRDGDRRPIVDRSDRCFSEKLSLRLPENKTHVLPPRPKRHGLGLELRHPSGMRRSFGSRHIGRSKLLTFVSRDARSEVVSPSYLALKRFESDLGIPSASSSQVDRFPYRNSINSKN